MPVYVQLCHAACESCMICNLVLPVGVVLACAVHKGSLVALQVAHSPEPSPEDTMLWATALAASDRLHNPQDLNMAVLGVCNSLPAISTPALDALVAVLPQKPHDRVSNGADVRDVQFCLLLHICLGEACHCNTLLPMMRN